MAAESSAHRHKLNGNGENGSVRSANINTGLVSLFAAELLLICYTVLVIVFSIAATELSADTVVGQILRLIICLAALSMVQVLRMCGYELLSAPVVLLVYLWMFHFALVAFTSVFPGLWDVFPWFKSWSLVLSWYQALLYSLMCLIGFVVGCVLARIFGFQSVRQTVGRDVWSDKPLYLTGMIIFVLGAVHILITVILHGGIALLTKYYVDVLNTLTTAASKGIVLASLGIIMAAAGARNDRIKLVVICQLFVSIFFLLLGMRSFALPVPVVLLVMLAKRGFRLPLWKIGLFVLILLWVISFARVVREVGEGVSGIFKVRLGNVMPVEALVEMGGTLQTVSLTFQWTEESGFQYGGGYVYAFERLFRQRNAENDRPDDVRSLEAQMITKAQGLGGSSIGESYYNFGLLGPLLYFLPLGLLIGILDMRAASPKTVAVLSIALFLGIVNGRGYFTGIPAYVLYAMVCWALQEFVRALEANSRLLQQGASITR